ncbi:hypothetical protein ABPG74_021498 [Tetrahymena malaccensis]
MNINRSNIVQNLPILLDKVRQSHFIAIDFEMTGLNRSDILRNNGFDTIQQRYWKTKESVSVFQPIQLGICPFRIHSPKKIEASPFNVYLTQYTENGKSDKLFLYSASTFNFLSQHNMDFNEVFKNGVYYFSRQQEEQFDSFKSLQGVRNDIRQQIVQSQSFHFKEFMSLNEKTIELFMENKRRKKLEFSLTEPRYATFYKELEQFFQKKFPQQPVHFVYDLEKHYQRRKITIQKLTEKSDIEDAQNLNSSKNVQQSQQNFEEYEMMNYNFRSIIDEIINLKIPIIVHNGFIDILHLYDKFLYNLPEGSLEFKKEINKHFPIIFDSKLIINSSQKLSSEVNFQSDLRNCYEKMLKYKDIDSQIFISSDVNEPQEKEEIDNIKQNTLFSNYQINGLKENNKMHEAGYDALMTGYIFFKSLQILNILQSYGTPSFDAQTDYFQNRLQLASLQTSYDIKDFDLSDSKSVDVFYIKQLNSVSAENKVLQDFFNQQLGSCKVYNIGNNLEQEYFVTSTDKSKFKYFEQKLNSEYNGVDIFYQEGKYFQIKTYQKYIDDLQKIVKEDKFTKIKNMDAVLDKLNQD